MTDVTKASLGLEHLNEVFRGDVTGRLKKLERSDEETGPVLSDMMQRIDDIEHRLNVLEGRFDRATTTTLRKGESK